MNHKSLLNTFERYGTDFQDSLIRAIITDTQFFEEIYEIISDDLFQSVPHSYLVKKTKYYYETYKSIPEIEHLLAIVKQEKDKQLFEDVSTILLKIKNSNIGKHRGDKNSQSIKISVLDLKNNKERVRVKRDRRVWYGFYFNVKDFFQTKSNV